MSCFVSVFFYLPLFSFAVVILGTAVFGTGTWILDWHQHWIDRNVQCKMHNKIIDANCQVDARKCLWKCDTFNTFPNANENKGQKNVHRVQCAPFECNTILMTIYDLLLYNCSIFLLSFFFLQFNFMCIRLVIYRLSYCFFETFCRSFFCSRTKLIDMTLAILLLLMFTFRFFLCFVCCFLFCRSNGFVYVLFPGEWLNFDVY